MSDEQDESLNVYGEIGDFEVIPDVAPLEEGPKTTEMYYMLCYSVKDSKWYGADAMIHALTNGAGTVLEGHGPKGSWRPVKESGPEADLDYDNVEILGEFLRSVNKED